MRLGLFGGTFDPPHAGHLAAARFVRERFHLDRVELVPACLPPHKPARPIPSPFHRYAMTVLATLPETGLGASFRELARGGISYTIETLREAREALPGTEIHFILGTDQLAEMAGWREPEAIAEEFRLIVVIRPGASLESAIAALPRWAGTALREGRLVAGAMEPVDVSSTEIRRRVREGKPISGLVSALVEQYIDRYELYRLGG